MRKLTFDGNGSGLILGAGAHAPHIDNVNRSGSPERHQINFTLTPNGITAPTVVTVALQGANTEKNVNQNGLVNDPVFAEGSTNTNIAFGDFGYLIADAAKYKAANAVGEAFSANHVVTADLFGVIGIFIDAAGAVTTKIRAATQATPQAYANVAAALANHEGIAPDSGTLEIGRLIIQADGGGWTANTNNLSSNVAGILFWPLLSDFTDIERATLTAQQLVERKGSLYVSELKPDTHYRLAVVANNGDVLVNLEDQRRLW